MAGPAGDGREGPGPGVGEKEDIVSPTLRLPEVSWHEPASFAISPDTVPSRLAPREVWTVGRRCLSSLLACPHTRVTASFEPSCPFGGHEERRLQGWVSFLPSLLGLAGSLERCPVSGHFCPGPGSPSPSFIPRARTADISPSHATSQPLSRPPGPHVFRSRPCVRLSGVAFLASLLP